jgi:hypothetical protein
MPPRSDISSPRVCTSRSTTPFQEYIASLDSSSKKKIFNPLVNALKKEGYLVKFDGHLGANECVFTYNNSDWYSIYLINSETGNQYWGDSGDKKLYFKIALVDNEPTIVEATTVTPPELMKDGVEMLNCVMKNGKCANPAVRSKKQPVSENVIEAPKDVLRLVEPLNVSGSKTKQDRAFFESFEDKTLLVNWMIDNMEHSDIIKCIKRGKLSTQEIKQLQSVTDQAGSSSTANEVISEKELETLDKGMKQLNVKELNTMLSKITKEHIAKQFSGLPADEKKKNIIMLCKRSGINKYKLKQGKKLSIVDLDDEPVDDINDVLNECARREAVKLRFRIASYISLKKKGSSAPPPASAPVPKELFITGGDDKFQKEYLPGIRTYFPSIKDLEIKEDVVWGKFPNLGKPGSYYASKPLTAKSLRIYDKSIK